MKLYVGTSGYSYKEWKGSFYPAKIPANEMLAYYSTHLRAVELNNTFYRLPPPELIETWKSQVPKNFRFSVKASQGITHFRRLKDAGWPIKLMLERILALEDRFGAVLFRLPENMEKDLKRLEKFLQDLPPEIPAAFDFRHASWFDDEVKALLRSQNRVFCVTDSEETPLEHIDRTADWGYVRLRRVKYSQPELVEWHKRIKAQKWKKTFVFFKHEDEGSGPKLAAQFIAIKSSATD